MGLRGYEKFLSGLIASRLHLILYKYCINIAFNIVLIFINTILIQYILTGADLGFSRGGGRIFKKFSKILTTFFFYRSTKLIFIFRALLKHCFALILAKFSAPQANF